jgi:hypothetical protein
VHNFEQTEHATFCSVCEESIAVGNVQMGHETPATRLSVCLGCWMHMDERIEFTPLQKLEYLIQLNEVSMDGIRMIAADAVSLSAFLTGQIKTLDEANSETLAERFGVGPELFMFCE